MNFFSKPSPRDAGAVHSPPRAGIRRRHLSRSPWPRRDGSHLTRGVRRAWWHWPAIAVLMALMVYGLILAMSDTAMGTNVSLMLRKLI
ncbi:MAG TPA: hypothetical protein VHP13_05175 [Gammaproteobacteria bacterium]|nr:hypothetical protein [Gammaproteobacteria bacterium]